MLIGYRTPGLRGLSFEQKLQLAKDLELQAIEVALREFRCDDDARRLRALAADAGIAVSCIAADSNMCDPSLRAEVRQNTSCGVRLCRLLGIDVLFSRTLWPPEAVPQKETWAACTEATREAVQLCADGGVRFALEADPPCFVQNLERVERLLDAVSRPNMYINFDPTNYYIAGSDPLVVIERLGHLMVNGHIKDGVYRQEERGERPIGEGEVDYAGIFRSMGEHSIDIAMNIEHCNTAEQVTSAARHIDSVLASM
jgi:sugar phosphate isomerase/epimerase